MAGPTLKFSVNQAFVEKLESLKRMLGFNSLAGLINFCVSFVELVVTVTLKHKGQLVILDEHTGEYRMIEHRILNELYRLRDEQ